MVEVTQDQELSLKRQLGKRKQTHNPTPVASSEQFDVVMSSDGDLKGHDVCAIGGGTHRHVCNKSKCGWCGWRGHLHQECTLEVELCHHCHQPGHIKENYPHLLVGAT